MSSKPHKGGFVGASKPRIDAIHAIAQADKDVANAAAASANDGGGGSGGASVTSGDADVDDAESVGSEHGSSVGVGVVGGGGSGGGGAGGGRGGPRRSFTVARRDFTVAKKTDFKKLAAKIAGEARKGAIQSLRAMGANNINTVVKGFALARRYIEEQNIDVNCFVQFIEVPVPGDGHGGHGSHGGVVAGGSGAIPGVAVGDGVDEPVDTRTAIRFTFNRTTLRSQEHRRADMEFKVGAASSTKSVAGAIAKNVRVFEQIALLAVGPSSVNQCIKAISIACRYCEEDNLTVAFRPRFTTIAHDNSESISGLRFTLYIMQI